MDSTQDFLQVMQDQYRAMSKSQKRIASYIMNEYDKAAYMTAARLGDKVGVSESTVVRFALELGYEGYPQLQKALQEFIRNRLTSAQRVELMANCPAEEILRTVLRADMHNIRSTAEKLDPEQFASAVQCIQKARRVYVLGMRSSAPLAAFLGHYLGYIVEHVHVVDSAMSDIFEQLLTIGPEDVLIGITFPRYSSRTIRGVQFASGRGAQIIAITDSIASPVAQAADHSLIVHVDIASFVDSIVAPMSLINALVVALGMQDRGALSKKFVELEDIWMRFKTYEGQDGGDPA